MKPPKEDQDTKFDPVESKRRFEAALLGARVAGHVPMKAKKVVKKTKPKKKPGK
jgi:hypothetical protein